MSKVKDANIDAVFGGQGLPEHSKLPERDVKPWHKPRKQWIRRYQWVKEIGDLCGLLKFNDGRPLHYLSLPGEDLLDIRVILECCAKRGLQLKYLGINDDYASDVPNTWLHISCNEVNSHSAIHDDSYVMRDRFEEIADRNSKAFDYIKKYGPFDIVNLDLCESISPLKQRKKNYYAALESLAGHQIRTRPSDEPWLLFITSRVGGPWVLESDMQKLAACVAANANLHREFSVGLDALVPNGTTLTRSKSTSWRRLMQPHFVSLFGVGLGKWLVRLLATASPRWGVRLLGSYSYRVYAQTPDLVSLAFLVESYVEEPKDVSGLSSGVIVQCAKYDEKTLALGLLDGVKGIRDLDQALDADKKIYDAMEQETYELLLSSRYKPATIDAGLKKFRGKITNLQN